MNHFRACFAEAFGTFSLVFAGTGAIVVESIAPGALGNLGIALVFGLVVMAMIYAVGEVSGAHLNPAVTIAFALARRLPWRSVPGFLLAQCLAAVVASALVLALIGDHAELGATAPREPGTLGIVRAIGLEVVFSWMLMLVILGVSTGAKEKGLMAGLAIGGTVALLAGFGGPLTGASMNPARSLGPAAVGGQLSLLWLYLVGPVGGTALAVSTLCLIRPAECCPVEAGPDGADPTTACGPGRGC